MPRILTRLLAVGGCFASLIDTSFFIFVIGIYVILMISSPMGLATQSFEGIGNKNIPRSLLLEIHGNSKENSKGAGGG